jgi:tetratricopeptide (TPR) repeat protein
MKHPLIIFCTFLICAVSTRAQDVESIGNPQNELIRRADSLIANYKFENALNILSKGDSMNVEILHRIGQCNFRLGASSATIIPYERILQIDSVNVIALNQLGQLYARDGDFSKALSTFLRLTALDPDNSYYCKQAGSMAARMSETTIAKFWFKKALNYNPADVEASLALGNILMETEEYESVDSIAQQALALDPQFKPILLLSAKSAFEQHQYESVIIIINGLMKKSDSSSLYARMLGVSYFHLKDYENVTVCMSYLLKNRYEHEWIYYYLGVASRELGDVPASINWFRMAGEKSISENTKIYYSELGRSYEANGDYQGAIKAYRAAYNYSRDGILLYHLARNYDVYYKDKATALAYYKKYLQSDDTIRLSKEYAKKRMQDMGDF